MVHYDQMRLTLFCQMFTFGPPENIRKPLACQCFLGDGKGIIGKKRVKRRDKLIML